MWRAEQASLSPQVECFGGVVVWALSAGRGFATEANISPFCRFFLFRWHVGELVSFSLALRLAVFGVSTSQTVQMLAGRSRCLVKASAEGAVLGVLGRDNDTVPHGGHAYTHVANSLVCIVAFIRRSRIEGDVLILWLGLLQAIAAVLELTCEGDEQTDADNHSRIFTP